MKNNLPRRIVSMGCATLLLALCAVAQEHQWAGRTLDAFEWTIHERLAALPSYGVFDTVRFEVQGKTVTLSGQVVKASVKQNAGRMVSRLDGVESVVNRIEVLPASRSDDALRMNVFRAIYGSQPPEKFNAHADSSIHIIVKDGWVTLEGVVRSDADRGAARVQAMKVSAHVSDNLRVAPESD
jgi:hypothetical protein